MSQSCRLCRHAAAVAQFLEETELTKKPKTLAAYTTALNYFTESCPKLFLQDIDRADLLKFCTFLRDKKKQAPLTEEILAVAL